MINIFQGVEKENFLAQIKSFEEKEKMLKESISELEADLEVAKKKNQSYKNHLEKERQSFNKLTEELKNAEDKIEQYKIKNRSMERENLEYYLQIKKLEGEVAEYSTQLHKSRKNTQKGKYSVDEQEVGGLTKLKHIERLMKQI